MASIYYKALILVWQQRETNYKRAIWRKRVVSEEVLTILVLCQNANWLFGMSPLPRRLRHVKTMLRQSNRSTTRDVHNDTVIVMGAVYVDVSSK
jgi:hypothetical protein